MVIGDAHAGLFPYAHRHVARDLVKGTSYNLDPITSTKPTVRANSRKIVTFLRDRAFFYKQF